jgi:Holliday junction resolvasome RuvABC endonuclease subunit
VVGRAIHYPLRPDRRGAPWTIEDPGSRYFAPHEVRLTVVGDPHATKIRVAHALVAQRFRELADRVPKIPKRAAVGLAPRDRYWLHMFDALAVAVAVQ